MAKQPKIYVCLVNFTDKEISYADTYTDMAEAIRRIQVGLEPQAALNNQADGKDWKSFGPSDTPFAFPPA